jgi:hypothetical protein
MAATDGRQQFEREVFPTEIEEIRRRRANVGDKRPLNAPSGEPSTKHDLVGLAFSGGGIRSASFSIGVVALTYALFAIALKTPLEHGLIPF